MRIIDRARKSRIPVSLGAGIAWTTMERTMQRHSGGPTEARKPTVQIRWRNQSMARETNNQPDQADAQRSGQSANKSFDVGRQPKSSGGSGASSSSTGEQTDRERSIQTNREGTRSGGVARRQATSPVYGSPNAASLNPFLTMRRMAEDMDRLFESFGFGRSGLGLSPFTGSDFDRDLWSGAGLQRSSWAPQVESFRRGDKLVVRADLPGMNKDDVKVEVEDGQLTISGERCEENEENRDDYYRSERSYGQFYRAIPLPDEVNAEQCDATFKDGVLEVTLAAPQKQDRKAKRVQIR
jgi:HSP20 family protein